MRGHGGSVRETLRGLPLAWKVIAAIVAIFSAGMVGATLALTWTLNQRYVPRVELDQVRGELEAVDAALRGDLDHVRAGCKGIEALQAEMAIYRGGLTNFLGSAFTGASKSEVRR
jgi:hypothetical protein